MHSSLFLIIVHPETEDEKNIRKGDIFRSGMEIKGLRGVVHIVYRTSNTADRHHRGGKEPFLDGN
jgi:hypothetical protein